MYQGYFINLDNSRARRQSMEFQLEALGLRRIFSRFPAINGSIFPENMSGLQRGEIGCFLSHMRVLEKALSRDKDVPVVIVEDDVQLGKSFDRVIRFLIGEGVFRHYDLIFFETLVPPDIVILKDYFRSLKQTLTDVGSADEKVIQVINLYGRMKAGFIAYLVNPDSCSKLVNLYQENLNSGLPKPVDILVRDAVNSQRLRAAVVMPFTATAGLTDLAETTITGRAQDPRLSTLIMALRQVFYEDLDVCTLSKELRQVLAIDIEVMPGDSRQALLASIVGNYICCDFAEL